MSSIIEELSSRDEWDEMDLEARNDALTKEYDAARDSQDPRTEHQKETETLSETNSGLGAMLGGEDTGSVAYNPDEGFVSRQNQINQYKDSERDLTLSLNTAAYQAKNADPNVRENYMNMTDAYVGYIDSPRTREDALELQVKLKGEAIRVSRKADSLVHLDGQASQAAEAWSKYSNYSSPVSSVVAGFTEIGQETMAGAMNVGGDLLGIERDADFEDENEEFRQEYKNLRKQMVTNLMESDPNLPFHDAHALVETRLSDAKLSLGNYEGTSTLNSRGEIVEKPTFWLQHDEDIQAQVRDSGASKHQQREFLKNAKEMKTNIVSTYIKAMQVLGREDILKEMGGGDLEKGVINFVSTLGQGGAAKEKMMARFNDIGGGVAHVALAKQTGNSQVQKASARRLIASTAKGNPILSDLAGVAPDLLFSFGGGKIVGSIAKGGKAVAKLTKAELAFAQKASVFGSAGASGLTVGVGVFGEARESGESYGKSMLLGGGAAALTMAVTSIGGAKGFESLAAPAARTAYKTSLLKSGVWREAAKLRFGALYAGGKQMVENTFEEFLEEMTDEFLQSLIISKASNPDLTIKDHAEAAWAAGKVGGVIGAGAGAIKGVGEAQNFKKQFNEVRNRTRLSEIAKNHQIADDIASKVDDLHNSNSPLTAEALTKSTIDAAVEENREKEAELENSKIESKSRIGTVMSKMGDIIAGRWGQEFIKDDSFGRQQARLLESFVAVKDAEQEYSQDKSEQTARKVRAAKTNLAIQQTVATKMMETVPGLNVEAGATSTSGTNVPDKAGEFVDPNAAVDEFNAGNGDPVKSEQIPAPRTIGRVRQNGVSVAFQDSKAASDAIDSREALSPDTHEVVESSEGDGYFIREKVDANGVPLTYINRQKAKQTTPDPSHTDTGSPSNAPKAPKAPKAPAKPQAPKAPKAPKAPGKPMAPSKPESPSGDQGGTRKAPESPEAPKAPQAPAKPQAQQPTNNSQGANNNSSQSTAPKPQVETIRSVEQRFSEQGVDPRNLQQSKRREPENAKTFSGLEVGDRVYSSRYRGDRKGEFTIQEVDVDSNGIVTYTVQNKGRGQPLTLPASQVDAYLGPDAAKPSSQQGSTNQGVNQNEVKSSSYTKAGTFTANVKSAKDGKVRRVRAKNTKDGTVWDVNGSKLSPEKARVAAVKALGEAKVKEVEAKQSGAKQPTASSNSAATATPSETPPTTKETKPNKATTKKQSTRKVALDRQQLSKEIAETDPASFDSEKDYNDWLGRQVGLIQISLSPMVNIKVDVEAPTSEVPVAGFEWSFGVDADGNETLSNPRMIIATDIRESVRKKFVDSTGKSNPEAEAHNIAMIIDEEMRHYVAIKQLGSKNLKKLGHSILTDPGARAIAAQYSSGKLLYPDKAPSEYTDTELVTIAVETLNIMGQRIASGASTVDINRMLKDQSTNAVKFFVQQLKAYLKSLVDLASNPTDGEVHPSVRMQIERLEAFMNDALDYQSPTTDKKRVVEYKVSSKKEGGGAAGDKQTAGTDSFDTGSLEDNFDANPQYHEGNAGFGGSSGSAPPIVEAMKVLDRVTQFLRASRGDDLEVTDSPFDIDPNTMQLVSRISNDYNGYGERRSGILMPSLEDIDKAIKVFNEENNLSELYDKWKSGESDVDSSSPHLRELQFAIKNTIRMLVSKPSDSFQLTRGVFPPRNANGRRRSMMEMLNLKQAHAIASVIDVQQEVGFLNSLGLSPVLGGSSRNHARTHALMDLYNNNVTPESIGWLMTGDYINVKPSESVLMDLLAVRDSMPGTNAERAKTHYGRRVLDVLVSAGWMSKKEVSPGKFRMVDTVPRTSLVKYNDTVKGRTNVGKSLLLLQNPLNKDGSLKVDLLPPVSMTADQREEYEKNRQSKVSYTLASRMARRAIMAVNNGVLTGRVFGRIKMRDPAAPLYQGTEFSEPAYGEDHALIDKLRQSIKGAELGRSENNTKPIPMPLFTPAQLNDVEVDWLKNLTTFFEVNRDHAESSKLNKSIHPTLMYADSIIEQAKALELMAVRQLKQWKRSKDYKPGAPASFATEQTAKHFQEAYNSLLNRLRNLNDLISESAKQANNNSSNDLDTFVDYDMLNRMEEYKGGQIINITPTTLLHKLDSEFSHDPQYLESFTAEGRTREGMENASDQIRNDEIMDRMREYGIPKHKTAEARNKRMRSLMLAVLHDGDLDAARSWASQYKTEASLDAALLDLLAERVEQDSTDVSQDSKSFLAEVLSGDAFDTDNVMISQHAESHQLTEEFYVGLRENIKNAKRVVYGDGSADQSMWSGESWLSLAEHGVNGSVSTNIKGYIDAVESKLRQIMVDNSVSPEDINSFFEGGSEAVVEKMWSSDPDLVSLLVLTESYWNQMANLKDWEGKLERLESSERELKKVQPGKSRTALGKLDDAGFESLKQHILSLPMHRVTMMQSSNGLAALTPGMGYLNAAMTTDDILLSQFGETLANVPMVYYDSRGFDKSKVNNNTSLIVKNKDGKVAAILIDSRAGDANLDHPITKVANQLLLNALSDGLTYEARAAIKSVKNHLDSYFRGDLLQAREVESMVSDVNLSKSKGGAGVKQKQHIANVNKANLRKEQEWEAARNAMVKYITGVDSTSQAQLGVPSFNNLSDAEFAFLMMTDTRLQDIVASIESPLAATKALQSMSDDQVNGIADAYLEASYRKSPTSEDSDPLSEAVYGDQFNHSHDDDVDLTNLAANKPLGPAFDKLELPSTMDEYSSSELLTQVVRLGIKSIHRAGKINNPAPVSNPTGVTSQDIDVYSDNFRKHRQDSRWQKGDMLVTNFENQIAQRAERQKRYENSLDSPFMSRNLEVKVDTSGVNEYGESAPPPKSAITLSQQWNALMGVGDVTTKHPVTDVDIQAGRMAHDAYIETAKLTQKRKIAALRKEEAQYTKALDALQDAVANNETIPDEVVAKAPEFRKKRSDIWRQIYKLEQRFGESNLESNAELERKKAVLDHYKKRLAKHRSQQRREKNSNLKRIEPLTSSDLTKETGGLDTLRFAYREIGYSLDEVGKETKAPTPHTQPKKTPEGYTPPIETDNDTNRDEPASTDRKFFPSRSEGVWDKERMMWKEDRLTAKDTDSNVGWAVNGPSTDGGKQTAGTDSFDDGSFEDTADANPQYQQENDGAGEPEVESPKHDTGPAISRIVAPLAAPGATASVVTAGHNLQLHIRNLMYDNDQTYREAYDSNPNHPVVMNLDGIIASMAQTYADPRSSSDLKQSAKKVLQMAADGKHQGVFNMGHQVMASTIAEDAAQNMVKGVYTKFRKRWWNHRRSTLDTVLSQDKVANAYAHDIFARLDMGLRGTDGRNGWTREVINLQESLQPIANRLGKKKTTYAYIASQLSSVSVKGNGDISGNQRGEILRNIKHMEQGLAINQAFLDGLNPVRKRGKVASEMRAQMEPARKAIAKAKKFLKDNPPRKTSKGFNLPEPDLYARMDAHMLGDLNEDQKAFISKSRQFYASHLPGLKLMNSQRNKKMGTYTNYLPWRGFDTDNPQGPDVGTNDVVDVQQTPKELRPNETFLGSRFERGYDSDTDKQTDGDQMQGLDLNPLRTVLWVGNSLSYQVNTHDSNEHFANLFGVGERSSIFKAAAHGATFDSEQQVKLDLLNNVLSEEVRVLKENDLRKVRHDNWLFRLGHLLGAVGFRVSLTSIEQPVLQTAPVVGAYAARDAEKAARMGTILARMMASIPVNGVDKVIGNEPDNYAHHVNELIKYAAPHLYARQVDGVNEINDVIDQVRMTDLEGVLDKAMASPRALFGLINKSHDLWLKMSTAAPDSILIRAMWAANYEIETGQKIGPNSIQNLNVSAAMNATNTSEGEMALSDRSTKSRIFQSTDNAVLEFGRSSFLVFSNHLMSLAPNIQAARAMLASTDPVMRSEGKKRMADFVIQTLLFNAMKMKNIVYLSAFFATRGIEDEDEREKAFIKHQEKALGYAHKYLMFNQRRPQSHSDFAWSYGVKSILELGGMGHPLLSVAQVNNALSTVVKLAAKDFAGIRAPGTGDRYMGDLEGFINGFGAPGFAVNSMLQFESVHRTAARNYEWDTTHLALLYLTFGGNREMRQRWLDEVREKTGAREWNTNFGHKLSKPNFYKYKPNALIDHPEPQAPKGYEYRAITKDQWAAAEVKDIDSSWKVERMKHLIRSGNINDGDSGLFSNGFLSYFHFRAEHIDTPESTRKTKAANFKTHQQASVYGLTAAQTKKKGKEAAYNMHQLLKGQDIYVAHQNRKVHEGRRIWSHVLIKRGGKFYNVGTLQVAQGYAAIRSSLKAESFQKGLNGGSFKDEFDSLKKLEVIAKRNKWGAWAPAK